ncbi:hypothetical protein [Desulfonatronovibrio magnus]|uniref:hypothetical protein n=1 Tax=Desulfonatronovibrio magnus TaxID=698827 RepID=UPI0005EBBE82|nr:hypothetical protein [Desulfonatronovibrio magnus]
MNSNVFVDELRKKFQEPNNKLLAEHLGVSYATIQKWHTEPRELTPKQVVTIVDKAKNRGAREAHLAGVRPIAEYYPIDASASQQGVKWELFNAEESGNKRQEGLKEVLQKSYGIYVFYDSKGSAIYIGKAKEQSLWNEMKNAFNRDRKTQRLKIVHHPTTGTGYRPAYEAPRDIVNTHILLSDMATYFSAYEVELDMIKNIEALLVRVYANGLLNARIEKFNHNA